MRQIAIATAFVNNVFASVRCNAITLVVGMQGILPYLLENPLHLGRGNRTQESTEQQLMLLNAARSIVGLPMLVPVYSTKPSYPASKCWHG